MKLVIFGLTITSSWGNGHATLWRGLVRALGARGHHVVFFERDVPYYAMHRDLTAIAGHDIQLYDSWDAVREAAARHVRDADVAMVTSYCPDAAAASDLVLGSAAPVWLLRSGYAGNAQPAGERRARRVPAAGGLGAFDLVLSYTGGGALTALRDRLGARLVRAAVRIVDPARAPAHRARCQRSTLTSRISARMPTTGSAAHGPVRRAGAAAARICGSSSAARCTRSRSRGRRTSTT